MKLQHILFVQGILSFSVLAQNGPFPPEKWPASASGTKKVHFTSVGDVLQPLGNGWQPSLKMLSGGDQSTDSITIGGLEGVKATSNYFNVADEDYEAWAKNETIDILVQIYGDSAVLSPADAPRNFHFLIGTLPGSELAAPVGGQIPAEGKNRQWNWVLFRIDNATRASDGLRRVGTKHADAPGGSDAGGVNGGTIRMENVPGLTVRAIAFGEEGAFGEPDQVNRFAVAAGCAGEPNTNYAYLDLSPKNPVDAAGEQLSLLNAGDQAVTIQDGIGPANDKRRAARANGRYMNFGIKNGYLGEPCNDPRSVKICVDYYDDPAMKGKAFGPEAYATDDKGGIGFYPADRLRVMKGTGQWVRQAYVVPAMSLAGVNTKPLTGGPRLIFEDGGNVWVSRFDIAILRTGTHPLAGQDPLKDCFEDLDLCAGLYGNYAELDLKRGISQGLAVGASGGDQVLVEEEAGPNTDRRAAVRNAGDDGPAGFAHIYLNFALNDEVLGPSSQSPTRLAISATYWDNPAMEGASFRPEVYITEKDGRNTFAFTPGGIAVRLQGTNQWRDAYFELPDVKFNGVNQGPQAAARFAVTGGKVHITRLRYGVIRPCGPTAGLNPLELAKPQVSLAPTGTNLRLSWPSNTTWEIQQSSDLKTWADLADEATLEGTANVLVQPKSGQKFYRLRP